VFCALLSRGTVANEKMDMGGRVFHLAGKSKMGFVDMCLNRLIIRLSSSLSKERRCMGRLPRRTNLMIICEAVRY